MPAEQHHVDLNRIIDRAEMQLEQSLFTSKA